MQEAEVDKIQGVENNPENLPTSPNYTRFSRGEVTCSLRAFTIHQGLWGAWSQMAGLSTTVMTGYALWLGADASSVALLSSIVSVMALGQLLAPLIGARFADEKRFILNTRMAALLLRGSILSIPFLVPEGYRFTLLVILLSASLLLVQLSSPYLGSWQSNIIPRNIRARFTSRATIVGTISAMVTGIVVGNFVDAFESADKRIGFVCVYAASMFLGWVSNRALGAAPYPDVEPNSEVFVLGSIIEPLRDTNFLRAMLFSGSSQFAIGLAAPFFSVYMLEHLRLTYTTISIFTAINMMASIAGYRIWAGLIDRFGGKPVLQLLLVPLAMVPLLWIFADVDSYWIIPVAFTIGGFVGAGVSVGMTPLMFDLLPQGRKKPIYLAVWSATVSLIYGLGPLLGSFLSRALVDLEFQIGFKTIEPLHFIFFFSGLAGVVPLILLPAVKDSSIITSRSLLRQISTGNLLRYIYNSSVYKMSYSEHRRARAILAIGRSHSPLAVEHLVESLRDASSEVRRQAAHALGESGSRDAIKYLVRELRDSSSDIRGESAEALGRLGMFDGVEFLLDSLDDDDPRIRISAIQALSEIKGAEVKELLFWHLTNDFEASTFPTLVDVLGAMGDRRIVMPVLRHLHKFRSKAIRLQLLNAIANGLGAQGKFYKLVGYEEHRRANIIKRMLIGSGTLLVGKPFLSQYEIEILSRLFTTAIDQFEAEDNDELKRTFATVVFHLRQATSRNKENNRKMSVEFMTLLQALDGFLGMDFKKLGSDMKAAEETLLAIFVTQLASHTVLVKEDVNPEPAKHTDC